MRSEADYVKDAFQLHFGKYKEKNIIIYGLGNQTKTLLDEFKEYNFIGLMDEVRTGEIVYGKKVMALDEVLASRADFIIILARQSNVNIIYHRIENFCRENQILVYDINGRELLQQSEEYIENHEYFNITMGSLKQSIKDHEIISFDIFDTLIMRKVLYPQDIFYITEARALQLGKKFDFARQRIMAEQSLNAKSSPNIYDIYQEIARKNEITEDDKNLLLNLELEVEKENFLPRYQMVELFQWAVESGKKIYLLSDMYLPKAILEDILHGFGIKGYQEIFISCEEGISKYNGLYHRLVGVCGNKSILHIGDNAEADGNQAKQSGLDCFLIKSAVEMLEVAQCRFLLSYCNEFESRKMVGLLISRAFNNPFLFSETKGKLKIDSFKNLGYFFVAPIITTFMFWLSGEIKNETDSLLLLSSRDGYLIDILMKKMEEFYSGETFVDSVYFLASRSACVIAGLKDEESIRYAATLAFSGKPVDMLKTRFFLDEDEMIPYQQQYSLQEYILMHKDEILIKAEKHRRNYMAYVESLNISKYKKLFFFDFAASGTCQLYLENFLQKTLYGLYFSRISEDGCKQGLKIRALFDLHSAYESQEFLTNCYIFLENIMTSMDSTLKKFEDNGLPVYYKEDRTSEDIDSLKEIHGGIIEFFDDYIKNCAKTDIPINRELADKILSLLGQRYSIISNDIFHGGLMIDKFCNREFEIWSSIN